MRCIVVSQNFNRVDCDRRSQTFDSLSGAVGAWAPIPASYQAVGSLEFSKVLLREAKVAVSPVIGFGEYGEGFVRIALVENLHRTRQAIRSIKALLLGMPRPEEGTIMKAVAE